MNQRITSRENLPLNPEQANRLRLNLVFAATTFDHMSSSRQPSYTKDRVELSNTSQLQASLEFSTKNNKLGRTVLQIHDNIHELRRSEQGALVWQNPKTKDVIDPARIYDQLLSSSDDSIVSHPIFDKDMPDSNANVVVDIHKLLSSQPDNNSTKEVHYTKLIAGFSASPDAHDNSVFDASPDSIEQRVDEFLSNPLNLSTENLNDQHSKNTLLTLGRITTIQSNQQKTKHVAEIAQPHSITRSDEHGTVGSYYLNHQTQFVLTQETNEVELISQLSARLNLGYSALKNIQANYAMTTKEKSNSTLHKIIYHFADTH